MSQTSIHMQEFVLSVFDKIYEARKFCCVLLADCCRGARLTRLQDSCPVRVAFSESQTTSPEFAFAQIFCLLVFPLFAFISLSFSI